MTALVPNSNDYSRMGEYYRPGMSYYEKFMIDLLGKGKENAVLSVELQDRFGSPEYGDTEIRKIIRGLIVEYHIPVASCTKGFYIARTEEEVQEYAKNLHERIKGIEERLSHFLKGWNETRKELRLF